MTQRSLLTAVVGLSLLLASAAHGAHVSGTVIGDGGVRIEGALVEVLRPAGEPPCRTHSVDDGTFSLPCDAEGRYSLRASFGELAPWQIEDVELAPDRLLQLNFLLRAPVAPADRAVAESAAEGGLGAPLENRVLAIWQGHAVTRRAAGIALAVAGFVLGAILMLSIGRHLHRESGPLSEAETADLVVNARRRIGRRLTPVVAGARGAGATVSYGVEEIAALLEARRHGVVLIAMLAPLCFAIATLGFAVAMLVDQPLYLFLAMMLVPLGFLLVPLIILIKARAATRPRLP